MFAKHPEVTSQIVQQLEGHRDSPFLAAAASSARALSGTMGFDPPSWQALCEGVREPEGLEPGIERGGWQHEASSRVERQQREVLFERLLPRDRAWVRSQNGPGGSLALTTCPTSVLTKIPPHLFKVVSLRRLRIPLRVIVAYMCVRLLVRLHVCHSEGPFWVHFGSILGPSWVHLASILGP